MKCTSPKTTALALGLTMATTYSLCAIVMAISPTLVLNFAKAVAHGVNLNALEIGEMTFTFSGYLLGLIFITAYAMIAGFIYGTIRNLFARKEVEDSQSIRKATSLHA
ncbi:MAG: hypothetical protein K2Q18_08405 [Bdellovibrionales bacterium]|nr:hypothetical protein [Bdellovibrionales bacterium]